MKIILCLGLVIALLVAVYVLKIPLNNLFYLAAFLACPLMHVWMMKDGKHKH